MNQKEIKALPVEMSGYKVVYQEGELSNIIEKEEYSIMITPMFLFSEKQTPVAIMLQIIYQDNKSDDIYKYAAIASFLINSKKETFYDGYSKEALTSNPIVKEMLQSAIGYARADLKKIPSDNLPFLPLITADSIIQDLIVRED